MKSRSWIIAVMSATLLGSASGCGSKPSVDASTAEATVSGSVKIRGKPMSQGEITFDPANYLRKDVSARTAKLKPDGTYEIKTLTGVNSVTVTGPAITAEPELGYAGTTLDVHSGTNSLDINLPPSK